PTAGPGQAGRGGDSDPMSHETRTQLSEPAEVLHPPGNEALPQTERDDAVVTEPAPPTRPRMTRHRRRQTGPASPPTATPSRPTLLPVTSRVRRCRAGRRCSCSARRGWTT